MVHVHMVHVHMVHIHMIHIHMIHVHVVHFVVHVHMIHVVHLTHVVIHHLMIHRLVSTHAGRLMFFVIHGRSPRKFRIEFRPADNRKAPFPAPSSPCLPGPLAAR